ncbi:MAG: phage holin family protein [Fibrobacter sp.]|nr:phage holin family protein [Fibrobacter sp.]
MSVLINIFTLSAIIYLITLFIPEVRVRNFGTAIAVAIIYSVLNFFFGWFFKFLSLPFIFLTFGLFTFVINAFFLWVTDKLISGFEIKNFSWTLITAFLISAGNYLVRMIFY